MDFLEPLLPVVNSDPDMSREELTQAAEASLLRQKILEEVLTGKRSEDDFNDLLRVERWDPDLFWETAETNIETFIAQGIRPDGLEFLESGLVIPRHY